MPVLRMVRDGEYAWVNTDHAPTYENFLAHNWVDAPEDAEPAAPEPDPDPVVEEPAAPEPAPEVEPEAPAAPAAEGEHAHARRGRKAQH